MQTNKQTDKTTDMGVCIYGSWLIVLLGPGVLFPCYLTCKKAHLRVGYALLRLNAVTLR